MADVFAPQPVKTKTNGDIVAAIVDSAGTNKATVSAGGAVKVDNSAVNQPVVGTGTAGSPAGNILTIQGATSMTKLLVTPDSVALPANQSVNVAQVAGTNTVTGGVAGIIAVGGNVGNAVTATANPVPVGGVFTTTPATLTTGQTATLQFTAAQNAKTDLSTIAGTVTDTNSGTKGAGTIRVVIATDQPQLTNKLLVTPDSVALPANQSVNVAQINGVTTLMGNGVTGTGSQRVTIASDNTPYAVKIDQTTPGTTNLVALAANQSINVAQIAGVTTATGSGVMGTGTQRVVLATDQPVVSVSQGLSFTTGDSGHLTSAALAAGATVTLDGNQIASGTAKLYEATVSSSVALKAQLGTWNGTTFVVFRTFFVPANASFVYIPARYDEITMATAATAKFRWSITNNDNANAADVYASITHAI